MASGNQMTAKGPKNPKGPKNSISVHLQGGKAAPTARIHIPTAADTIAISNIHEDRVEKLMRNAKEMFDPIYHNPDDVEGFLALADVLEESDLGPQSELLRMHTFCRLLHEGEMKTELSNKIRKMMKANILPVTIEGVNHIGMRFSMIPPGAFLMGNPESIDKPSADDWPHIVALTNFFGMAVFTVTQGQWEAVMGENPAYFRKGGDGEASIRNEDGSIMDTTDFPIENIDWTQAQNFCKKLTEMEAEHYGLSEPIWEYRLPTEAEWEMTCKGGLESSPFFWGHDLSSHYANFDGNHPAGNAEKGPNLKRTCEVGSYLPNSHGVYDMHGNVWEWCGDWYDPDYYRQEKPPTPEEKDQIENSSWYKYWENQDLVKEMVDNSSWHYLNRV